MDKKNRAIIEPLPNLLPKCSCGYVFGNLGYNASENINQQDSRFDPSACPSCHRKIISINLQSDKIDIIVNEKIQQDT